ncbi:MAG: endonuclease/exonuclease/phosphatase family protein, partial [Pseudomonadota bacterium]
ATDLDWLTYRDGDHVLPQRANFFRDVCAALPDHAATFCPAAQGVLWDNETQFPSQWGLATFVHKSIPVIGQAQGFVHKSYGANGYGNHPRSRSAHGVQVYDHKTDRGVSITHMHGLRDLAGKMDTPERTAQAHKLAALSNQVSDPGDVRIICGDFNVTPDSDTFTILRDIGMTDLVTTRGFTSTRNTQYKKPGKFADYMLISDPNAVHSFDVEYTPEVSDHCPLTLHI